MLKRISRYTSSLAALLGASDTTSNVEARLEEIRNAMLQSLEEFTHRATFRSKLLCENVSSVHDIQTLWYLRSDLMRILSDCRGEQAAQIKLDELTEMFRGVVHQNQMPGPRRMGRL
jgi:hypothetical protein